MLVRALSRLPQLLDVIDPFTVDSTPPVGWITSTLYDSNEAIGGQIQPDRNPAVSASGQRSLNYYGSEFASDDQDVQVTSVSMLSGTTQTNYNSFVGLRGAQDERTYTALRFLRTGSTTSFAIDTVINDAATARISQNRSVPAGSLVRMRCIGNVYTAYFNGVQALQWVDSSNVFPVGANYRRAMLRTTSAKLSTSAAITFGPGFDDFMARDVGVRKQQRAVLSNSQVLAAASTWYILGAPLRADLPNCPWTSINGIAAGNHAIVADGNGKVQIDALINASGAAAATVTQVRVTVNGTVVGSTTVGAAGSKSITHTAQADVVLGDLIRVEVFSTGTTTTIRTIAGSSTSRLTEFTVTPI
jgi:hypothetical protein